LMKIDSGAGNFLVFCAHLAYDFIGSIPLQFQQGLPCGLRPEGVIHDW
jgi:hypothetical protein